MKKINRNISLSIISVIAIIFPLITNARSGCCSHHGGVCGCGCCDGTSLSSTCAPYYPSCNKAYIAPTTTITVQSITTTIIPVTTTTTIGIPTTTSTIIPPTTTTAIIRKDPPAIVKKQNTLRQWWNRIWHIK